MISLFSLLASFTAPEEIGVNPESMLWMLPLTAAIAVVYKAIRVPQVTAKSFVKESIILFGSIVAFVISAAIILSIVAYLATE